MTLPGSITGLSLQTQPEDIYLALLQAIVCGTGAIIDQCSKYGVKMNRLVIGGGIAQKNPLLMAQYANLLGMPVQVAQAEEVPALGAGIFAAVAAGVYATPFEAYTYMGVQNIYAVRPDEAHPKVYQVLYEKNRALRICIAQHQGAEKC